METATSCTARRHHNTSDPVAWVRHVNGRFAQIPYTDPVIEAIRGPLTKETVPAWLAHLEISGHGRLLRSCRVAAAMECVRYAEHRGVDPKPFFFGGLFALAHHDEIERFLTKHRFTKAIFLRHDRSIEDWIETHLSRATRKLLELVRSSLNRCLVGECAPQPPPPAPQLRQAEAVPAHNLVAECQCAVGA